MSKDSVTTLNDSNILDIAYIECKNNNLDPSARTPDGPLINSFIKSVKNTVKAIEDCGYRIVKDDDE